jgi:homoserine kinase
MRVAEITVPASTSNLGSSFDVCGLALALYLRVGVEASESGFEIVATGEGAQALPRDETNLIVRVARSVAEHRGKPISGARLVVSNEIPLARGLGSSSAAIVAGVSLYETLAAERLSDEEFFSYALKFEDHGDNLAPGLMGGLVVACIVEGAGDARSLVTVKRAWPEEVKIVLAVPEFEMETARMRAALPEAVPLADAVFNLQRAALLQAAISEKRFELIGEALRDRLHQPYRAPLAPGLKEALRLNEEAGRVRGLLGVALSGAGSTVAAFITGNGDEIAAMLRAPFEAAGLKARTLEVAVDNGGRTVSTQWAEV